MAEGRATAVSHLMWLACVCCVNGVSEMLLMKHLFILSLC